MRKMAPSGRKATALVLLLSILSAQVAAGFPLPPPATAGGSSSWAEKEATTAPASSSSLPSPPSSPSSPSSPSPLASPPLLPSRLLGLETPLQERVEAAAALAAALGQGNNLSSSSNASSSSSSLFAAAAKHDAVSASVAAADAVALLAWGGDAAEALGAVADAADAASSSADDLLLSLKDKGSGRRNGSSVPAGGPLRSAEAAERAAAGALAGKAASALDAAAGALINKTRASWSEKARPWLSRAAEALSDAKGGEQLPVDAEGRLEASVASALSAADGKRAGLRAAADAKIAEKLAGGSKAIGEMGILVQLELGSADPLDPGVGTEVSPSSSSSSSSSSSVSSLFGNATSTTAASPVPAPADGWNPKLLTNTGGPDFYFDQRLASARAVGDAFEALVRARLAADGVSGLARRLASAAVALDPERGLYEVRLAWRSGGSGAALASALAAVNDASPRDPCRSWAEVFDVCSAIQRSSALNVVGVRARADTAPPGAHAGRMQLGRRLRGGALPSPVGSPQVLEYRVLGAAGAAGGGTAGEQDGGRVASITQGNLKDLYWFIDKALEGAANFANGYKEWRSIGVALKAVEGTDQLERISNVASDASKKWAAGLTKALGAARGLLGVVGGAIFIAGLAGLFLPSQPDPQIMASLKTIQVVTNETLSRVKEIQSTLGVIQKTLEDIRGDIAKSTCTLALTTTDASVTVLRDLYRLYYGPLDSKGDRDRPAGYVGDLAEYLTAGRQPDPALVANVDGWADDVIRKNGVADQIDFIYGRISGRTSSEESVLRQCRTYFVDKVASSGPMPIDDRMLYADITKIVAFLVTWQTRGLQMLTEAYHWRAQSRYAKRMAEVIRSSCNSTLTGACSAWSAANLHVDPQQLCEFAVALNISDADPIASSPLLAARSDCKTLETARDDARFQIARSLELAGAPYSFGEEAGAGARLVLGTDFTLGASKRRELNSSGVTVVETASAWLVPASPGAFDGACSSPAALFPDPAGRSNCTLFGRHGDGGESWAGLGSPLGYAASLWKPAGLETWFTLRYGMNVSAAYNGGAVGSGPAGNLLLALESTLEGAYQVPMSGLSDRTWWISGHKIPKLFLGDFALRNPAGYSDVAPVQGSDYGRAAGRYWISDEAYIRGSLAFAAVDASDRTQGPAGVVFARSDFRGMFSADCERLPQDHDLRFKCADSKDFAASCPVKPSEWLRKAFPYSKARAQTMTIQCPTYPYEWYTDLGEDKPDYARCGLSTLDRVAFRGKGTDTTCCFERVQGSSFCIDGLDFTLYTPTCNRYEFNGNGYCQDMSTCLGSDRMAWPFWSGAALSTDDNACYTEREETGAAAVASRLPTIDIRSVPRVVSPFTGEPYCETSSDKNGLPVNLWGVPTLCGPDMTRFISDVAGSSFPDARDNATWPRFDAVNNTATRAVVSLLADGDTVTCEPEWVRADGTRAAPQEQQQWAAPSVVSKVISVSAGPISVADAGVNFPTVGVDLYSSAGPNSPPQTNVSLSKLLGSFQPALPRTILCAIRGRDLGNDGLPVFAFGTAAVVSADGSASGPPVLIPEWDFPLATCAGGRLVNNATDAANCGSCGTVCPAGSECFGGVCTCSRIVTTSLSVITTRAVNVTARLLGGGGGAAGGVYEAASSGAAFGGGGGGGSTAVAVRVGGASSPLLVAAGGAGGRPAGLALNATAAWYEAEAQGLPGEVAIATVAVAAGATLDVVVGGGGGGGGSAVRRRDGTYRGLGGGGSGGAGFFGGGGGFGGVVNGSLVVPGRATGGTAAAGGSGAASGASGSSGGDGTAPSLSCPSLGCTPAAVPAPTGGQPALGGRGENGRSVFYRGLGDGVVGGVGGGGSLGAGGGAGTSGAIASYDLSGGGPGSDGGGGASGASTWAGGIRVGAGAGGKVSRSSFVSGGGNAGLAILRWPAAAGSCAL